MLILSIYISTWLAKETASALSTLTFGVAMTYVTSVYGWYSDNSVLLQEAGIYSRTDVYYNTGLRTPALLQTRRLLGTRRLMFLRYDVCGCSQSKDIPRAHLGCGSLRLHRNYTSLVVESSRSADDIAS